MAQASALDGKLVVVTGGSGFLGQHVVQALLARGSRVRIVSRHPEKAFALKPLANLGQLQFARLDIADRANAVRAVSDADAVVSLAGSFTGDLARLMGDAPGWLATAAKTAGAQAFVHVSALCAPSTPEAPNGYAEAKRGGEEAVRAAFPTATIMRPGILFGAGDRFTSLFAGLVQRLPALPVFGPEARLQPLFVGDAAEAIVRALEAPGKFGGKVFELAGPEVMTMLDFHRSLANAQGRKRHFLAVPDELSGLFAALPGTPMSRDQWTMLKAGTVADPALPGIKALGITPRPLALFLDRWMTRYRRRGRFADRAAAA